MSKFHFLQRLSNIFPWLCVTATTNIFLIDLSSTSHLFSFLNIDLKKQNFRRKKKTVINVNCLNTFWKRRTLVMWTELTRFDWISHNVAILRSKHSTKAYFEINFVTYFKSKIRDTCFSFYLQHSEHLKIPS